jgi:hypothetical protein
MQAVGGPEPVRELRVDACRHGDVDADQPGVAGLAQQARDLEATEPELLSDLHLGGTVQIVAAGDRSDPNQVGKPQVAGAHIVAHGASLDLCTAEPCSCSLLYGRY